MTRPTVPRMWLGFENGVIFLAIGRFTHLPSAVVHRGEGGMGGWGVMGGGCGSGGGGGGGG